MKNFILFILTSFASISINAQDTSGIYYTSKHFMNDSAFYLTNGKLKTNFLFDSDIILLKNGSQKIIFHKDSIYGYCKENICYRFYLGEEYKIEDTGRIVIYSKTEFVNSSKGNLTRTILFFSTTPDDEILPLNLDELLQKLPLPADEKFDLLQTFDDSSILKYDLQEKKYKINIYLRNHQ